MKRITLFILSVLLVLTLAMPVFAHGGRTDSSGGHTDRSTGEYHYHHGYSAHNHWDMDGDGILDCPYEFKDTTNSKDSSTSKNDKPNSPTNKNSNFSSVLDSYREKQDNSDVSTKAEVETEEKTTSKQKDNEKGQKHSGVGTVILELVAPIVLVYIIAGVCVLFINLKECVEQYRYRHKHAKGKENQICIPKKKKKN